MSRRMLGMLVLVGVVAACLTGVVESQAAEWSLLPMILMAADPGPDDADAPKDYMTTKSGLKYRVLRKGTGKMPTAKNKVKVHYQGTLENGKVFDSSYKRNEPIEFPLSGVIKGWTEGMQLVGEGGKIELVIPGDLAYGPRGIPGTIPANATLNFIVELIEVK